MNKNKLRRNRPDMDGNERGIYSHNRSILRKTATVCALCGMPFDKSLRYPHPMSISIDHIIPVALGGRSTIDNLQATHLICNKSKGKKVYSLNKDKSKTDMSSFETEKNYVLQNKNKASIPQYVDWSNYEC